MQIISLLINVWAQRKPPVWPMTIISLTKFVYGIGYSRRIRIAAKLASIAIMLVFGMSALCASSSDLRESAVDQAVASSMGASEMISRAGLDKFQVIFLGENHWVNAGRFGYHRLLSEIFLSSKSSIDCLTLEAEPKIQPLLLKVINKQMSTVDLRQLTGIPIAYDEIFDFVRARGIRLFAIDDQNLAGNADHRFIAPRNKVMARRISTLLSSGTCKRLIHLSGAQHYSTPNPKVSLQNLIRTAGISSLSFWLEPNNKLYLLGVEVPTLLHWPGQTWEPQWPKTSVGFWNPRIDSEATPPRNNSDRGIHWTDFDATLLLE